MRSVTAYFFLFVYLFANTELHELAKFSAFVTHYRQHQTENKDLTVLGFIKIHYFSGIIYDEDYAQDMKLPFKVIDCSSFSPTHTIPLSALPILKPVVFRAPAGLLLYDQSAVLSTHLTDIWQPPKAC